MSHEEITRKELLKQRSPSDDRTMNVQGRLFNEATVRVKLVEKDE